MYRQRHVPAREHAAPSTPGATPRPEAAPHRQPTRPAQAGRLRDALLAGRGAGAVLVAPKGHGKAALVEEALTGLLPAIEVTGSGFAQPISYGALLFLVSRLDRAETRTPEGTALALGRLLGEERPDGAVFSVRNPELLDPQSAALLARLAIRDGVKLAVQCTRVEALGRDLGVLLRSGTLERIDVGPLGFSEAQEQLARWLGGPASPYATAFLWEQCQGAHTRLRLLVRDCVSSGKLQERGGVWVLVPGPLPSDGEAARYATAQLVGLGPADLEVLRILARQGTLAAARLHAMAPAGRSDRLYGRGLVRDAARPGHVEIADPLVQRHLAGPHAVALPPPGPASPGDPGAREVLALVRSLSATGDHESVRHVVDEHRQVLRARWLAAEPYVAVAVVQAAAEALYMAGRGREALPLVQEATRVLEGPSHMVSAPRHMAERTLAGQRLELIHASLSLRLGDRRPAAALGRGHSSADAWTAGTAWENEGMRLEAAASLALAWAGGERQEQAAALVDWIGRETARLSLEGLLPTTLSPEAVRDVTRAVLHSRLGLGQWRACRAEADRLLDTAGTPAATVADASMVRAVLAALAGDPAEALALVLPGVRQLQAWGPPDEAAAAAAVAAHSLAELGEPARAQEMRLAARAADTGAARSWTAAYFTALAEARLGQPQEAAARLAGLREESDAGGHRLVAALAHAALVQLGDGAAAGPAGSDPAGTERLTRLAGRLGGSFGQALARLAGALELQCPVRLGQALVELAKSGHGRFALEDGNALTAQLDPAARRALRRELARLARQRQVWVPEPPGGGDLAGEAAWAGALTLREKHVALAVADGQSNADVARRNGISVRTVEGHLYQVYAKLSIRDRAELRNVVHGTGTTADGHLR